MPQLHMYVSHDIAEKLRRRPEARGLSVSKYLARAELATQGSPIGANDLVIAATARAYDAALVTHNTRELSRVPGLKFEDWQEQSPGGNGRGHDDDG